MNISGNIIETIYMVTSLTIYSNITTAVSIVVFSRKSKDISNNMIGNIYTIISDIISHTTIYLQSMAIYLDKYLDGYLNAISPGNNS